MKGEFPKRMIHPSFAPAIIGPRQVDGRGRVSYGQSIPERYPAMLVENPDQEEETRARGYLAAGEAPAPPVDFEEYPLMMAHPDHRDAIPDEIIPQRMPDNSIQTTVVPGQTEKFPHVAARDAEHEEDLAARGYQRMGRSDPAAVEAAVASPYVPGRTKSDYPKWVDGVLIQDPAKPSGGPAQYPKWLAEHNVEVQNEREEAELMGAPLPVAARVEVLEPTKNTEIEDLRAEMSELKAALAKDLAQPAHKVDGRAAAQKARRERENKAKSSVAMDRAVERFAPALKKLADQ